MNRSTAAAAVDTSAAYVDSSATAVTNKTTIVSAVGLIVTAHACVVQSNLFYLSSLSPCTSCLSHGLGFFPLPLTSRDPVLILITNTQVVHQSSEASGSTSVLCFDIQG